MEEIFKVACAVLGIDAESVNSQVFFVGKNEIQELNMRMRDKDKPTDVLSFPMLNISAGTIPTREVYPLDINPNTNKLELGDIIICRDFAKLPIDLLCVHGFLHLLGYNHETEEDWRLMTDLTNRILDRSRREIKK